VHHCTFCSPLNKGDDGFAFGVVRVHEDALEVVGPRVHDLLPAKKRGQSTGLPAAVSRGDVECVTLPLREKLRGAPVAAGETELASRL